MKKGLLFFISAITFFSLLGRNAFGADISAKAAILYEPRSRTVLFEKSADEAMLIASTTKIMTAKVVIDNCSLDETVSVSPQHTAVEGSSMYLIPGERYTVEDLLYGLMLASGNDAAAALADHVAGSMEGFAELMNAQCAALGLENTNFVNSHGLDAEEHYSTARDLALITAWAMEDEIFCRIFSTLSHSVNGVYYTNHNKLLKSCSGCIGGKTGYTEKAGRILVSCVERDGMRLICVTISDPKDWEDHAALYDRYFDEYEYLPVLGDKMEIPVISGLGHRAGIIAAEEGLCLPKGEASSFRLHLPAFVFAPVKAGDTAGRAELLITGGGTVSIDIYYSDSVPADPDMAADIRVKNRLKRALQDVNQ